MATIAIGDIHGWREPLDELLATIRSRVSADDTVVFLGDYIDRGNDSRGCIDAVLTFRDSVPARVVCLVGNHEEWLLETMQDYRAHSWLLGMDGFSTIRSYSPDAERTLRDAASNDIKGICDGSPPLPYEAFFDVLPASHREFLTTLAPYCQTPDGICTHAGVHPSIPELDRQGRVLTWGHAGFPDEYRGPAFVLYGHHNNAAIDADGWPRPRRVGRTIGLDTISHGVLTAVALPGPEVVQSARYDFAVRGRTS
jgi:serine/threonine protein phosphatase 1